MTDIVTAGAPSRALKGLGSFGSRLGHAISNTKLAREAFLFVARRAPLRMFKKLPTIIIIDVTNSCNLRCPVCPVTFAMHRPRGLMKLEIFQKIVDDFEGKPKPAMYFNFSGEPTMNKALPDMIAYATKHGHETFVSTNATKLSQEMIDRLIQSGLSRINLCIDGFSAEAQEAYRKGSKFEAVKANIENFLATKQRIGMGKGPKTVLQTLLTSYSEKQTDAMIEWADDIGFDEVRFKTFSLGSYTDETQRSEHGYLVPTNPELQRHQKETVSIVCDVPLYQTVVFWNGDLGLCCIDYDQVIKLPNVEEKGFLQAYLSDEAARARRTGYTKSFDICQDCSYSNADNMGFKIKLKHRRKAAAALPKAA